MELNVGEEPQAPEVIIAPQEPDINSLQLGSFTDDELSALESGDLGKIQAALKIPDSPAIIERAAAEEHGPDRLSLKSISDKKERVLLAQATQLVRDGGAKNLREAISKVFAFDADTSVVEAPVEVPLAPVPSGVLDIEAEISRVAAAYREAKTVLFDPELEQDLMMQLIDLKSDLKLARVEAVKETAVRGSFEQQENESRENAISMYGEMMTDPDSEFNELLEVEIILAERKNDPILSMSDWPENIANRTFAKHKARLGGGVADPIDKPTAIPPHPGSSRLPGAPVGRDAQPVVMSMNNALTELSSMSFDERMAVLLAAEKLSKS